MKAKTSTESKRKYNKDAYETHLYSYRKRSELGVFIREFKASKNTSLNHLITTLLCKHFGANFPHPESE